MQAPGGLHASGRGPQQKSVPYRHREVTDEKKRHCLRAGAYDDGDFTVGMFRRREEFSDGRADGSRGDGCGGEDPGRR